MLVWLTFCKGTLKARKLWSNLAALSSQLSHDNEIHSGLVFRLPPQHATLCFFFLMRSYFNNTCKAKTIVTDNYTSRLVGKKKGFQKARNKGILCHAVKWRHRKSEVARGGKKNCCHDDVRGIKGIQVKVKKKTKKTCTSHLREFFYLPRLHHGKKNQTNHPKQNNLKSYTCLMKGYRRKVWQNKRTAGALMNLQTGPRSSVSALTAEERHYGTRPGCRDSWILSSKAHYYWTLFLSHWIKNYTLIYIKLWYRWTITHVDISAWHKNTEVKSIQLTCSLKKQANKRTDEVSRVSPGMTV